MSSLSFRYLFSSELFVPSWAYGLALGLGMVLSLPLIWTTNYEVREDNLIYAKKNWGFVFAFVGIILIRLFLRKELTGSRLQRYNYYFILHEHDILNTARSYQLSQSLIRH
ncbi:CcdC protein domain-containing protein [Paenibacillus sp. 32352]